jgi:CRISPR system Cascade subunit CasB
MTTPESRIGPFIAYLEGFVSRGAGRDRAALANLRRGLGKEPGEAPEMFPYLVPWTGDLGGRGQEAFYAVASLFARHPAQWPEPEDEQRRDRWRRNFGASMRRVALSEAETVRDTSTERRFVALLNGERRDIPERLRHAISLCAAKDVPVNWQSLLGDLLHWEGDRHRVQRDWARAFWQDSEGHDGEPAESPESEQPVPSTEER